MKKKVIYVSSSRLTDIMSRFFYIDYLVEKGITVEYWDVVSLLRGEFDEPNAKYADYLRTLRTYSEVEAMLRLPGNRDAIYVMGVSYYGRTTKIFRLLSKYNYPMLFITWGYPPTGRNPNLSRALSSFSNPLRLAKKIFSKAKAIAYRKLKLVKPFDIAFAAGQVLMTKDLYASKMVPINMPDYDQYREVKLKTERLIGGCYAVFLDEYLPHHSDLEIVGQQAVKPIDYYASVNRFFELLEIKYGIEIVIAAHPKAHYSTNPFHDRKIYYLRTHELVRDADFVITHASASISYAVLNHKPIIFIYTNEMLALYSDTFVRHANNFANYLDAAIYNVDKLTQGDQIIIRAVNSVCYENYKYNYITTRVSEHTTTQEIFWHEINALIDLNATST